MKISLFLGAGASVPFGMPVTSTFKIKISSNDIKGNELLSKLLRVPEHTDIEHTLRAIEDIENIDERGKQFLRYLNKEPSEKLKKILIIFLKI